MGESIHLLGKQLCQNIFTSPVAKVFSFCNLCAQENNRRRKAVSLEKKKKIDLSSISILLEWMNEYHLCCTDYQRKHLKLSRQNMKTNMTTSPIPAWPYLTDNFPCCRNIVTFAICHPKFEPWIKLWKVFHPQARDKCDKCHELQTSMITIIYGHLVTMLGIGNWFWTVGNYFSPPGGPVLPAQWVI